MRSIWIPFLGTLVLATPGVAMAQVAPTVSVPPPPAQPSPPAAPAVVAAPVEAAPSPPRPTPVVQVGGVLAGPATSPHETRGTFEANLGLGVMRVAISNDSDSENGLGFGLGGGVFATPRFALTARLAGVSISEGEVTFMTGFLGPSVQYLVDDHFWIGGGIGIGFVRISDSDEAVREDDLGFDLRAGYTINPGEKHTFNASVELTWVEVEDASFTGVAVLAGYQFR